MNKLISIIVPVFNEEDNVRKAYEEISTELSKKPEIRFEIIFTDNHSTDSTFSLLEEIAKKDNRVKVIRFTRNFGFNKSILTGYRLSEGDAAIQIDCDLEDSPSVFHEFISLWKAGHDVVVGVREQRQESKVMIYLRKLYYKFLNSISDTPHQMDAGDFRLVDRSILDQLKIVNDCQPYVRGLISELASNQAYVNCVRSRRESGKSKFPIRQLINLALDGIYSHSTVPLKLATYTGLTIALVTSLVTAFYLIGGLYFDNVWPAGFATTTVLILFGISLNALFLGIIGEYVGRIYQQVRVRPTVVYEKTINLDLLPRNHESEC
jgi:glycosyltransferase involved in cell wall biosynthesis